jgi:hypothetical protein
MPDKIISLILPIPGILLVGYYFMKANISSVLNPR